MSARIRILHLLPTLERAGGQTVVLELVRHTDRTRFETTVAFLGGPRDLEADFQGAAQSVIELRHSSTLGAARELARHVRRHRIDVIHVHSDIDRKVGQLAALASNRPVVGHLHSPWPHLAPMHDESAAPVTRTWSTVKARCRRWIEDATVHCYVAAGAEVAAFHRGRLAHPIVVADNGIDVERFRPASTVERATARSAIGLGPDQDVLVCVGRLADGKGQADLISALRELPDSVLVLAGDGPRRHELLAFAESLNVTSRVRFLGECPEVASLLHAADLFVFASRSEGLPMCVLESMATAVPVVAYELPGLRAVIEPGVNGAMVPNGDIGALRCAISALLDDDTTRGSMSDRARRKVVECFDARRTADRVTEIDMVLSRRTRRDGGLDLVLDHAHC